MKQLIKWLLQPRWHTTDQQRAESSPRAWGEKLTSWLVDRDRLERDIIDPFVEIEKRITEKMPGSWMVFKDIDREYADQICSEQKNRRHK